MNSVKPPPTFVNFIHKIPFFFNWWLPYALTQYAEMSLTSTSLCTGNMLIYWRISCWLIYFFPCSSWGCRRPACWSQVHWSSSLSSLPLSTCCSAAKDSWLRFPSLSPLMQCFRKSPQLRTWSACGPNCWNGLHLGRISLKRSHFPILREKW